MTSRAVRYLDLLGICAWFRRKVWPWLYRQLPAVLRQKASTYVIERTCAKARFPRTPAWSRSVAVVQPKRVAVASSVCAEKAPVGVNIVGYIGGQFGLAEGVRLYARALIESGVDVSLLDVDLNLPHQWNDKLLNDWIEERLPYPVTLIFINPDYFESALAYLGPARTRGRYLVACWFWELENVPPEWVRQIEKVDAIMVASAFVENAFKRVTKKPIFRVPLPVGSAVDSGLKRADFGLEEGKFIFLLTFDFNSWVARKNPLAVIQAFVEAFPAERDDVRLVVKSSNGFRHFNKFRELLSVAGVDRRIMVRDEVLDRAHLSALQRCCDAYVSLHRSEGYGLGLAECMLLGKPVIATAWSGNMEFMDPSNSCLIGYRLVSVGPHEYPSWQGQRWAEADIHEAAIWMRKLADQPGLAEEIGSAARSSVSKTLSFPSIAKKIVAVALRETTSGQQCQYFTEMSGNGIQPK